MCFVAGQLENSSTISCCCLRRSNTGFSKLEFVITAQEILEDITKSVKHMHYKVYAHTLSQIIAALIMVSFCNHESLLLHHLIEKLIYNDLFLLRMTITR